MTEGSITLRTMMKLTGEERREDGRAYFTTCLGRLLQEVSHPEMAALADWALNEAGCLHTSQLSHLRNAKMRMLGVKSIDALGAINVAAFRFKTDRHGSFKELNTAQTTARIEEILERFEPLLVPETGDPVNAGDLMMIYLGYLKLDLPGLTEEETKSWDVAADKLGPWIEDLLEEKGIRLRDGVSQVKSAWAGPDKLCDHFCFAITGMGDFKPDELAEAWPYITKVVSRFMDEDISEDDLLEMVTA